MKNFLAFLFVIILFCSCNPKPAYHKKAYKVYEEAVLATMMSQRIIDQTNEVWYNAIYNDRDSHGNYCSDFNEALAIHRNDYEGLMNMVKQSADSLQIKLADIKDAPNDCKDEYDDLVELSTDVISLARLATNIEGSLQTYRESTHELNSSVMKKFDSFKIKHADLIKDAEENKKKKDEEDD